MNEVADSIGDIAASAAAALSAAGLSDSRREALQLMAAITGSTVARVMLNSERILAPESIAALDAAVARRAAGEPLAYVTGSTGFRHLELRCDPRALIPRPETEGLVDGVLARCNAGIAADVGTGTGALALALAHEGHFDEVIGIDVSIDALALARDNGHSTGLAVTWLEGDLLAPLAGRRVNLLVSNPPYISTVEYGELDRSVRDYEPDGALLSGRDGLEHTRRLLEGGRSVLAPGGWIALEIDCRRAGETAAMAAREGWEEITVQEDLFGRARYLFARHGRDDD